MEYLTEEYWHPFTTGDRNRGRKFEELVAVLLSKLDHRTWEATPDGGDGAKDFVRISAGDEAWAECKIHANPVSFRTLGPTLVMAILHNVSEIYFFSYTNVTAPTLEYLAQFGREMGKHIRLFDDITLEKLILTYWDSVHETFFPAVNIEQFDLGTLPSLVTSQIHIDNDIEQSNEEGNFRSVDIDSYLLSNTKVASFSQTVSSPSAKDYTVKIRQLFALDIFLRNFDYQNSQHIKVKVGGEHNKHIIISSYFISEDKPLAFILAPAELKFLRIQLLPISPGTALKLPEIIIEAENQILFRTAHSINVRPAVMTGLVGKQHVEIFQEYRSIMLARRRRNLIALIYGRSGTGKSRIINEIRDEHLRHGHTVLNFNMELYESHSFQSLTKKIISRLYQLPLVRVEPGNYDFERATFVERILYDPDFSWEQDYKLCVDSIIGKSFEKTVVLIIDNIQNLDEKSVSFLQDITLRLSNAISINEGFRLVFSLNLDLSPPGTPCRKFNDDLITWAIDDPKHYLTFEVKDLSKDGAVSLMSEIMTLPGDPYATSCSNYAPLLIEKLMEGRAPRPLFLIIYVHYLLDLNILRYWNGKIDVESPDALLKHLQDEPMDLKQLIAARWKFILRKPEGESRELRHIVLMASTFGSLSMALISRLGLSKSDIFYLEDIGILKIEQGKLLFFHNDLFRHFSGESWNMDAKNATQIKLLIERNALETLYPIPYFISLYNSGELNQEWITHFSDALLKGHIAYGAYHYLHFLLQFVDLLTNVYTLDGSLLIRGMLTVCNEIKRYVSHTDGLKSFDNCYNRMNRLGTVDIESSYYYFYFFVEYANAFFAVHEGQNAYPILNEAINKIPLFAFPNPELKQIIEAHLFNRLSVAVRYLNGDLNNSIAFSKKALDHSLKTNDIVIQFISFVDCGNALKYRPEERESALKAWKDGVAKLERINLENFPKHISGVLALTTAKINLLEGNLLGLPGFIDHEIERCKVKNDQFNIATLLVLKSVTCFYLQDNKFNSLNMNTLLKAQDFCTVHNIPKFTWVIPHLMAKLFYKTGDTIQGAKHLALALEKLERIKKYNEFDPLDEINKYFYRDAAILFRENNKMPLEDYLPKNIRKSLYEYLSDIFNLSESDYRRWKHLYRPLSIYNFKNIDYPII